VRVPPGYVALRAPGVRVMVRADLADTAGSWLVGRPLALPAGSAPLAGGRGATWRVTLPGGVSAVLRRYRRGGAVARLLGETYLGFVERPFRELVVTEAARQRGVAAPEVLAARVEGRVAYGGALVTAEIPGAITLFEALRVAPDGARRQTLATAAGRVVGCMHRAGVWHADLNLTNLLVGAVGAPDVTVLDFDRARLTTGPLRSRARRRNLARLARSLRKLDPAGRVAAPEDVAAFHAAYAVAVEAPCGC
jgi:3-deoxy-D-manno-octulosonic acid kinase